MEKSYNTEAELTQLKSAIKLVISQHEPASCAEKAIKLTTSFAGSQSDVTWAFRRAMLALEDVARLEYAANSSPKPLSAIQGEFTSFLVQTIQSIINRYLKALENENIADQAVNAQIVPIANNSLALRSYLRYNKNIDELRTLLVQIMEADLDDGRHQDLSWDDISICYGVSNMNNEVGRKVRDFVNQFDPNSPSRRNVCDLIYRTIMKSRKNATTMTIDEFLTD